MQWIFCLAGISVLLIGRVDATPPQNKPEKQDADRSDLASLSVSLVAFQLSTGYQTAIQTP
jgi:hypothetical protein